MVLFLLDSAIHTAFHFNDTWISTCRKPKPEITMHMAVPRSWFLQTSSRTQNFTNFCGASDVGEGVVILWEANRKSIPSPHLITSKQMQAHNSLFSLIQNVADNNYMKKFPIWQCLLREFFFEKEMKE